MRGRGTTIGSLFAGIGGLELGLEWAGLGPVAWQVERDPWCRGVLAMHWPQAKRFRDVRTVGRHGYELDPVDVICGGFPCQDVSSAGKGAGLDGERSGLWREFARIVREVRPAVVVVENVAALTTRGLDRVVADLDAAGYRVEGRIIAAEDVGAPHRRQRLFLVAYAPRLGLQERRRRRRARGSDEPDPPVADDRHDGRESGGEGDDVDRSDARRGEPHGRGTPMADPDGDPVRDERKREPGRRKNGLRARGHAVSTDGGTSGRRQPQPGMGRMPDGLPVRVDRWPSRPGDPPAPMEPPRTVTAYQPTAAARLRALGNAVVPQVAAEVGAFVAELLR